MSRDSDGTAADVAVPGRDDGTGSLPPANARLRERLPSRSLPSSMRNREGRRSHATRPRLCACCTGAMSATA